MKKLKPRGRQPVRLEGSGSRTGPTRPPQQSAPERQPNMILVGLIYGGIGLLALGVAAVTFLMIAPPTDLIRSQIVAEVRAETGREFKIQGPASFTFFPSIGMRVRDVSLSAPPEMGGEPLLTAQSLAVGVRLWPLIRQEIIVDRLVLTKPVFNLRVDTQGRRSWDMAAAAAPVRFAQAATTLSDAPMQVAANDGPERRHDIKLGELSLGDVRIIDGTAHYADERDGTSRQVTAIDAEVQAPSLVRPVDAKGSFLSEGEKIAFDAKITSLGDIVNQRPAKLALNVTGRPLNVRYDGAITLKDDIAAEGNVSGDTTSFRTLAQWLGTRLPRSNGFGPASIVGNLTAGGELLALRRRQADARWRHRDRHHRGHNLGQASTRGGRPQGFRPQSRYLRGKRHASRAACRGPWGSAATALGSVAAELHRRSARPAGAQGQRVHAARRLERRGLRPHRPRHRRCRRQAFHRRPRLWRHAPRQHRDGAGTEGPRAQDHLQRH